MTDNDENRHPNLHPNVTLRGQQYSPLEKSVLKGLLENSQYLNSEDLKMLEDEMDFQTGTPESILFYHLKATTQKKGKRI